MSDATTDPQTLAPHIATLGDATTDSRLYPNPSPVQVRLPRRGAPGYTLTQAPCRCVYHAAVLSRRAAASKAALGDFAGFADLPGVAQLVNEVPRLPLTLTLTQTSP